MHVRKGILDYIHSEFRSPSPIVYYGISSYFMTFIDDYSRKVWTNLLKRKVDAFNVFKQFRDLVEKRTSRTIKC